MKCNPFADGTIINGFANKGYRGIYIIFSEIYIYIIVNKKERAGRNKKSKRQMHKIVNVYAFYERRIKKRLLTAGDGVSWRCSSFRRLHRFCSHTYKDIFRCGKNFFYII